MNAIDKAVACASTAIAPTATEKSDNAAAQARKTKAVNTDRTEHRHRSRRHSYACCYTGNDQRQNVAAPYSKILQIAETAINTAQQHYAQPNTTNLRGAKYLLSDLI